MKQKLSISIDEEKVRLVEKILEEGKFRNKSHILEYSLNKFLREVKDGSNI
jgi:Arc/MetJ-type ribon-helix-helix transcriptional regulator